MFKYTVSKQILFTYNAMKTAPYVKDKEYFFFQKLVPQYSANIAFRRACEKFELYSETKLKLVPVEGFQLPVKLFDCEVVQ